MICASCGHTNYDTAPGCVRCGAPLAAGRSFAPSYAQPPAYGAPPFAYGGAPPPAFGMAPAGVWADGATLLMHKQAQLPHRCVRCNSAADVRRLNRQLWYIHPALYALVISPLIFLIVYLIVRKGARIDVPVCEAHVQRRRNLMTVAGCLMALGILGFVAAAYLSSGIPFVLGLLVLLASLVVLVVGSRHVTPAKIDEQYVWLKGVSPEFLASLPPARPR
jgi:hypothetical protein